MQCSARRREDRVRVRLHFGLFRRAACSLVARHKFHLKMADWREEGEGREHVKVDLNAAMFSSCTYLLRVHPGRCHFSISHYITGI
uniref:Uncharacterized protein n=1 Tax=Anguilla anguilla TaxID=7936 RepID=A0A0E9WRB0_ANGAN